MMPILSPFRESSLMSARTAKYVEAMIREGDSFDYNKWLQKVCVEEAQAKQPLGASVSGELDSSQIGSQTRIAEQLGCTAKRVRAIDDKNRAGAKGHKPINSQTAGQHAKSPT